MTTNLTKAAIKVMCIKNDIKNFNFFNISSKNKSANTYWVNPNIVCLRKNWLLVLNDNINNILYCLLIPANSISESQIKVRSDKPYQIDLQLNYDDINLRDKRSGIYFSRWLVKTINY